MDKKINYSKEDLFLETKQKNKNKESKNPKPKKIEKKKISLYKLLTTLSSKKENFYLFIGIIGGILNGIVYQLLEYYTGKLITYFAEDKEEKIMKEHINQIFITYIIIGFLCFFFGFLLMTFCSLYQKKMCYKYKIQYFEMLLSMNQKFFDLSGKSNFEISNQVILELTSIENGIGTPIGFFFYNISSILFSTGFSLYINFKFTLIIISIFPLSLLTQSAILCFLEKYSKIQRKSNEQIGGYMEEILYKVKTIASFSNFDFEIKNFKNKLKQNERNSNKKAIFVGISESLITFYMGLIVSLSIIIGSYLIYKKTVINDRYLNSGDVYIILQFVMNPSSDFPLMTQNLKLISEAREAACSFFELRKIYFEKMSKRYIKKKTKIKLNETVKGKIEFKNVYFSYPKKEDNIILKNLNIIFEAGKTTALIGESGTGKSTIVNLIERIYKPQKGIIVLDDKYNINEIDIIDYRKNIGYVSQEPVLFNDTIRNNIIFGRQSNENEVIESTKKSYIFDFINKVENKFNYIVGIKGGKISGGQKQRIAIARAILKKPQILIFDEATSSLDNKNEQLVQESIKEFTGKATIIIIAHRLNFVKFADQIIFIGKEGEILEKGNHKELMNIKGKYYSMYMEGEKYKKNNNKDKENENENEKTDEDENMNIQNKEMFDLSLNSLETELKGIGDNNLVKTDKLLNSINKTHFKEENTSHLKKLYIILLEYKLLCFSGIICSFLSGVLIVLMGLYLGEAVDKITSNDLIKVKKNGIKYGIIILIIGIIQTIVDYIRYYSIESIGEKISSIFKVKIFKTYLKMHLSFFDIKENNPGKLVSKMNINTSSLNEVFLTLFSILIQSFGNFFSATLIGVIYDWRMTLVNTAFIPFIFISNYINSSLMSQYENMASDNNYGSILSETLCNSFTIYSFNAEENSKKLFKKEVLKNINSDFKICFLLGIFNGLNSCLIFFDYGTTFYLAGNLFLKKKLTLENFLKCYATIMTGTFCIGSAVKYIKDITLMKEAIKSLFEQIEIKSEIDPFDNNKDLIVKKKNSFLGKIEFKNVTFSYPINHKNIILKNLNFIINPGEKIGIIGPSGSGKSSITQLIERFYDVSKGEILIDDVNIKNYNLISLRKIISIVLQEPNLFNESIYENIKYGDINSKKDKINFFAKKCKIDYILNSKLLSNELSGGEKQRVAIARALIRKSKILILDEATSALDNKTENEIQKLIDEIIEQEKITVIVIAHRMKAVNKCNRFFKIENGKVVEIKVLKYN